MEREAALRAGEPVDLAVTLAPLSGTLAVTSNPAGAQVLLDGEPIGVTPLAGREVVPGRHVVEVERAWHWSWRRRVTLEDGQVLSLAPVLPSRRLGWALAGGAVLATAGAGLAAAMHLRAEDDRKQASAAYDAAHAASDSDALGRSGDALDKAEGRSVRWRWTALGLGAAAVGLAAWSVYELLAGPPADDGGGIAPPRPDRADALSLTGRW